MPLVFVHTLYVHVEQRVRVQSQPERLAHECTERLFGDLSLASYRALQRSVTGLWRQVGEAFGLRQESRPYRVDEHLRQSGVGAVQPAAEGDAVRLVAYPVAIEAMQVGEHGLAHEIGVQRGDAVHRVAADESQVAHAQAAAVRFVDQGQRREQAVRRVVLAMRAFQVLRIQHVDDLHVPRQQPFHQRHRPGLQGFRQQRMVGVAERGHRDAPGLRPVQAVDVHQQAHHLGHRDRGMGVVHLDGGVVGQGCQVGELVEVARHEVLQGGRGEEELLAQTQFLSGVGIVAWVEHAGDGFRAHPVAERAHVVAAVELVEVEFLDGAGRPQAQRVRVISAAAHDRCVVGDRG